LIFLRFGDRFGGFWTHFGVILVSFWSPFDVQGGLGTLLGALGRSWEHFGGILRAFWSHFGAILGAKIVLKSYKKYDRFYIRFLIQKEGKKSQK